MSAAPSSSSAASARAYCPRPRPAAKPTPGNSARPARGFTLVEVVIALAIFATLTAALISISNSLNIVAALRAYQVSAWVADNHVEFARIDGLEKNLSYTTTLFGTEYISKIKLLEKPYKEIFVKDPYLDAGQLVANVRAPACSQFHVSVYREYASEPEFRMLACIFPKQDGELAPQ